MKISKNMQELLDIIESIKIKADIINDITINDTIHNMAKDIINSTEDIKDYILN